MNFKWLDTLLAWGSFVIAFKITPDNFGENSFETKKCFATSIYLMFFQKVFKCFCNKKLISQKVFLVILKTFLNELIIW